MFDEGAYTPRNPGKSRSPRGEKPKHALLSSLARGRRTTREEADDYPGYSLRRCGPFAGTTDELRPVLIMQYTYYGPLYRLSRPLEGVYLRFIFRHREFFRFTCVTTPDSAFWGHAHIFKARLLFFSVFIFVDLVVCVAHNRLGEFCCSCSNYTRLKKQAQGKDGGSNLAGKARPSQKVRDDNVYFCSPVASASVSYFGGSI